MSKERLEQGEKHFTSTVFVVTNESPKKVLLVHHRKLDRWMPPGGHREERENPYECAVRETREETGIDISPYLAQPKPIDERVVSIPLPKYIFEERIETHEAQTGHYHLDMIYVVFVPYQDVVCRDSETHSIGWFTKEEAVLLSTFDNVRMLLTSILSDNIGF